MNAHLLKANKQHKNLALWFDLLLTWCAMSPWILKKIMTCGGNTKKLSSKTANSTVHDVITFLGLVCTVVFKMWQRWSTCVVVYSGWLLNHVIYLKLRRELLLCPGWTKLSFCEFGQLYRAPALHNSYFLLSLRQIAWANWSRLKHM